MIQHNLDQNVAENPEELIVYGGKGKAARDWKSFDLILKTLLRLEVDETLIVQSGKPVAVMKTHVHSPRVLIANSNLVPKWATWEHFDMLEAEGLIMYGQMTAGSWIYIGTQGILQGTYETFIAAARKHFNSDNLSGKIVLTSGLGGMGGAQPLAVTMAKGVAICIEIDNKRIVHLNGEIDMEVSDKARNTILPLIEAGHEVHLNLSKVEYMDSSGISVLVESKKLSEQKNTKFELVEVSKPVEKVLAMARKFL